MEPIQGPTLSKESADHSIAATTDTLQANEECIKDAVAYNRILKFEIDPETMRILHVLYGDHGQASIAEWLACLLNDSFDRLGWKFYVRSTAKQSSAAQNVLKFHIGRRQAYDGH